MSDTVNTGFILDMQRKLYRWSAVDPDKRFADLFNIVCDRGTLFHAWQRLALTTSQFGQALQSGGIGQSR